MGCTISDGCEIGTGWEPTIRGKYCGEIPEIPPSRVLRDQRNFRSFWRIRGPHGLKSQILGMFGHLAARRSKALNEISGRPPWGPGAKVPKRGRGCSAHERTFRAVRKDRRAEQPDLRPCWRATVPRRHGACGPCAATARGDKGVPSPQLLTAQLVPTAVTPWQP